MPFYANACRVKNSRICMNKNKSDLIGDVRLTAALLPSGSTVIGYSNGLIGGPPAGGSLVSPASSVTEIIGIWDQPFPGPTPPPQITIRLNMTSPASIVPTSYTFTGGDLSQPYTLTTSQANISPPTTSDMWVWFNHGFALTVGQSYDIFLNY